MWLVKIYGVILLAVTPTAGNMPSTTFVPQTSNVYEPPVPSLQQESTWPDVFPSEKVELICNISGSSDWNITWYRDNQAQDSDPNVSFSADGSVLTITAVTQMYSGSYFCKGYHNTKDVSTQNSNSLVVRVYANKPQLTVSRRPNFDKMFPGESVTFTCSVNASSGWEYLWYHNRNEIQATNTDTYTIESIGHSHSGLYHCKAKRGKAPFETEESDMTSLQVSDPPTPALTLLSPWHDVFTNERVEFRCDVNDPDWSYTWYKNQKKLDTRTEENRSLLKIPSATPADHGVYACRAHLESRNVSSDFSNHTALTVHDILPKPSLSKFPDFTPMYVGETVNFTCNVDVSSGWTYQWYRDANELPSAMGKTVSISLSLSDGGGYSCSATRGGATSTSRSAEIPQGVKEIPVPDLKRETEWSDVFPTESVTLSCGVQGSSDWTFTWYRDGQKVQADSTVSFNSDGTTLSISSAAAKHAGQYSCKGHLPNRPVNTGPSPTLTLSVHDKKPTVILRQVPEYAVMFPGESVSFSCHINISSGWEYLYSKDGNQITGAGNTYSLNSVGTGNGGSYTCQTKRGKTQVFLSGSSQAIPLQVEEKDPKPLLTQVPKANTVYAGEPVTFRCKVEISSGWEYLWYKDATQIPWNRNNFVIHNASSSDSGNYVCKAKRDKSAYQTMQSDTQILQISEIPVPDLKRVTEWSDVFPTESVTLSCGVQGSSDWTFTWYRDGQKVQADSTVSFNSDGTTLSISSAAAKHAGQYSCSGKLKTRPVLTAVSAGLTLSVYDTKPRVALTRNPEYEVMHTEDSVTFSCHTNVSSGWEYMWYKDGTKLATSGNRHKISVAVTSNTGSYSCQVKRGQKTVLQSDQSQPVKLDIQERPQANIILLTGWSEVFSTDSLVLRCQVPGGQDMWNYTWFREGQRIDLPPSEKYTVTPQNDPEQSLYTCCGNSTGRPSYSKRSDSFRTKNLLLKRRVLLSISGCLFFGLIAVFLGCIILRITRKPVRYDDKPEEDNLFLTMAQLKDRTDAPNPLAEYITDEALNASPEEEGENGIIPTETTPLPITSQEDEAVTTESNVTEENNGGLVSFKQ